MFAAFRLSLSFLTKRERFTYFFLITLRTVSGLLDVFGIFLIGFVAGIGASQLQSDGGKPLSFLGFTFPAIDEQGLVILVLFVLAVFAFKTVVAIVLSRILTAFIAGLETGNAEKITTLLLRGSLDDVKKFSKAEIGWAVTGSTTFAFTGLLNSVATIINEGFLLIFIGVAFIVVDPVAAAAVVGYFAIVVVLIQLVIGRSLKKAGVEAAEGTIGTYGAINDTLDTFREISVLGRQQLFIDRIITSRAKVSTSGGTMTFLSGMPRYVVETALILGVVLFVGQQFIAGQLSSGIVVIGVFLTGGVRIMGSLLPLQNAFAQMTNHVQQAELAQGLLTRERTEREAADKVREAAEPSPVRAENGGLEIGVDSVVFRYPGDDTDTLHGISFDIKAGQHVAFIGPSGAGKTTLVDLMLGLIEPSSGSVQIGSLSPAALRTVRGGSVAYVPQKPGLVSGTIAENIALGVPPEQIDHDQLRAAVEAAHLKPFLDSLPDGIDSEVGKQADALSGGQVQRIGLARALYVKPSVLILDEATSALDAGSEAFVSESLRNLGSNVTVVVIAHRLSTVQHSDVVFVVESGSITASGKFAALRKSVPMVAEYVKLMSFDDK